MNPKFHNGGAYCRSAFVAINKTATAAGTGDATEVDGAWVDRKPSDAGAFMSAKLVIAYTATLAATKTLAIAAQFRDATDSSGTSADDYGDAIASTVVATGPAGGGTVTGTVEVDVDLAAAREFIQAQVTPDLNASGTDTVEWSAVLLLFGTDRQPITQAIDSVKSWE
ncbi:hypothetical protein [Pleomorphomonas sp. PLEO]|uniref:hypothetical protein n=1 Tax=Pleomorphomonas sp. PLEO TaxID=3239306 RepID=UPI00351F20B0